MANSIIDLGDPLSKLSVKEVNAWYKRMLAMTKKTKVNSKATLSSQFLDFYLTNRSKNARKTFPPPPYIKSAPEVQKALIHHRKVFLTEEKGTSGGKLSWLGAIPRLKDKRWSGNGKLNMKFSSSIGFSPGLALLKTLRSGSTIQKDLACSLHTCLLESNITINGSRSGDDVYITFRRWTVQAVDRYDFDKDKWFPMLNPDYKSNNANAVSPKFMYIGIFHKNAFRMQDAKLAAPYDLIVGPWEPSSKNLLAAATVDAGKWLMF